MPDFVDPALNLPSAEQQAAAVDRLLSSGEFSRSPNLEKIFRYLTREFFAGRSSEIKEFTIATEALGRGVDFDPKRDSIVRVEMHRLRRRLKDYYASRGASDPVYVSLPEKSYSPEFTYSASALVEIPAGVPPVAEEAPPPPPPPPPDISPELPQPRSPKPIWIAAVASFSVFCMFAAFLWFRPAPPAPSETSNPSGAPAVVTPTALPRTGDSTVAPDGGEVRILAGRTGGRFVDRFGQTWMADQHFTGGNSVPVNKEIRTLGLDPNLFAGMREGDFTYDIPLADQPYELTLYFAETEYGGENPLGGADASRAFHVRANDKPILNNFDVIVSGGEWGKAIAKVFRDIRPASDGKLHLRFQSSFSGKAFVNAIELRPGLPGRMRPIRLVCQPQSFRDSQNRLWQPNMYFSGGKQITRPSGAPVERDGDVFRGERYGRFNFTIPVAPGRYTVNLYFWEYWWGPGRPGGGGPGSRSFSVFANFKPLLENLDVIAASDNNQFLMKSFTGIRPDSEGRISLDFVPLVNNAMLNALEILDEAKP